MKKKVFIIVYSHSGVSRIVRLDSLPVRQIEKIVKYESCDI